MNGLNAEMLALVKDSLKVMEKTFEKEPVVLIDDKGRYWINDHAREFISGKGLHIEDFMEWLVIGSSHLQNLSYEDIDVSLVCLPGNNVAAFLRHDPGDDGPRENNLTPKEKEVLKYLVKGWSNKEIADIMHIKPGTVNTHLDNIYQKLNCSNRLSACFAAIKHGFFIPSRSTGRKEKS